ncbi:MAG: Rieske 2Fe-2S domain-containing protein [Fimbriimonadales bacterium]|nr:Rieske 2Fe-2S domain-containing protein [Fimbriimonadales bacterium]MDW8052115.1 Rieske 2Fe-2S domain-containing protein [Armatimonadota bacterium]
MWVKAIRAELAENEFQTVELNGQRVLIGRGSKGYFAVVDRCSHQGLPLSEANGVPARIQRDLLECPHHGARFDPYTGQAKGLPAIRPIKALKVKEEDGYIWVALE